MKFVLSTCLSAVVLPIPDAGFGAPLYQIADIGVLEGQKSASPSTLNDKGTIVGTSGRFAFVWTAQTGISQLPFPDGGIATTSAAYAINNIGQIVEGGSLGGTDPGSTVIYKNDQYNSFLRGTWAESPNLGYVSYIADNGRILGRSSLYPFGPLSPWVWTPKKGISPIIDNTRGLSVEVFKMNERGQVVGTGSSLCSDRAFTYDVETAEFTWIGEGAGQAYVDPCGWHSQASSINEKGEIVGWSTLSWLGNSPRRAFRWKSGLQEELTGGDSEAMVSMAATDINEDGQIVGNYHTATEKLHSSFFYWDTEAGAVDIADLIDPSDPLAKDVVFQTGDVYAYYNSPSIPQINNQGQVLVTGSLKSEGNIKTGPHRTFLLTPVR